MFRHRRAILKEFKTVERQVCRTLIVHESHTSKKSYTYQSNITPTLIINKSVTSVITLTLFPIDLWATK
jgi:plastocyanin domain-containing protein